MGGEIGVESRCEAGRRFWFDIPFRKVVGKKADAGEVSANKSSQRHLHILLAEDNRINQMLVRAMLQKMGHTVVVADNGRVAVNQRYSSGHGTWVTNMIVCAGFDGT